MAKDIKRHISHLKSSGTTAPAAADLLYGEIAVGYGAGDEVLYIKNSSDAVIPFVNGASALAEAEAYADSGDVASVTSDSALTTTLSDKNATGRTLSINHTSRTEQSGFNKLSTDAFGHVTAATAVALSDLTSLGALSGVTADQGLSATTYANGTQKISHTNQIEGGTAQGTATKTLAHGESFDIPSVTFDANGHITTTGTTTLTLPGADNAIVSVTGASGITATTSEGAVTVGHTNNVGAGSAQTTSTEVTATVEGANIDIPTIGYDAYGHITGTAVKNVSLKVNAASTSTAGVVQLADATGSSTATVMTQSAVTAALNEKAIASSAITSADYDSTGKTIVFKNAAGTQVDTLDATAFIKDGMVSSVEIKDVAGSGSCLVVTFNSDAGKEAINIPLTSIFDPSNYYTTAQTSSSTEITNALALKSDTGHTHDDRYYTEEELTGASAIAVAKALSASTAATAQSVALANVTDADDLKAIEALAGTSGILKKTAANTWTLDTNTYLTSAVQSVSLESGTNNGTLKLTVDGTATDNIAVKGLGAAAFMGTGTTASDVAVGNHTHTIDQVSGDIVCGDYA